jgi:hypothetical protein
VNFSNEVLLNIFRYYLDAFPRFWPRLAHICRKWRHIVFASQRALHLQLFCTRGKPVLKTLDCWPTLPIVVQYEGAPSLDPLAPDDEDNIVAVLKQSDRVRSINLTVTSSLLEKLSAIERPFLELEDLVLLSREGAWLTLPSTFRWGVRLRTLHLTLPDIPALPKLLSLSTALVDLQLDNIPNVEYFSPNALANALSGMSQLRTLLLHFLSFTLHRNDLGLRPQSRERISLPALTRLKYRGSSEYLDSFVTRIDAPRLMSIDITFLCRSTMDASQLGQFLTRIKMQQSCRAEILSSERAISISFTPPGAPTSLELRVSCHLTQRFSYMAQICNGLSASLQGVEYLRISARKPTNWWDCRDLNEWGMLIHPFRGTKWVHVSGDHSTNIVLALRLQQHEAVLPALHKLCIREPEPCHAPLREAVVSFVHSRWLSGHIIGVEYELVRINELRGAGTKFVQRQFAPQSNVSQ